MNFFKILFFIILFYGTSWAWERLIDGNNKHLNETTSRVYDVLIKVFECHKEDYSTLLISSDINKINLKLLQKLQGEVSIFFHRHTTNYNKTLEHLKKFDAFVFIIDVIININTILLDISQNTLWQNVVTPIYIVFVRPCDIEVVENIFRIIDAYEVLTSYLLCSNTDQELKIYTYNCISDYAPEKWKPVEEIELNRNLVLFERPYVEEDICSDFDFDRTRHLGDYEIIVAGDPQSSYSTIVYNFYYRETLDDYPEYLNPFQMMIVNALAIALPAKIIIYFHAKQSANEKYLNSWEIYKNEIWLNSSCDIFLTPNTMSIHEIDSPFRLSYPTPWSEEAIVTYHQGYQTPIEKIREFYGIWISLFTLFILIATFIVIWFTENRNIAFTIFEIIRLLISQGLHTRMNTLSLRIFFGVVLIYFLIIQATFNGHLAKFLTKPELRKHPDTLKDLRDLGITEVYNWKDVHRSLARTPEDRATLGALIETCIRYLIHNNTLAACTGNQREYKYHAREQKNVYVSKKTIGTFYMQYPIYRWSPLYSRLYRFFILYDELGFQQYTFNTLDPLLDFQDKVYEANLNENFLPINLENLIFAFILLGIGLCAAVIAFIIEKCLNCYKFEKINCKIDFFSENQ